MGPPGTEGKDGTYGTPRDRQPAFCITIHALPAGPGSHPAPPCHPCHPSRQSHRSRTVPSQHLAAPLTPVPTVPSVPGCPIPGRHTPLPPGLSHRSHRSPSSAPGKGPDSDSPGPSRPGAAPGSIDPNDDPRPGQGRDTVRHDSHHPDPASNLLPGRQVLRTRFHAKKRNSRRGATPKEPLCVVAYLVASREIDGQPLRARRQPVLQIANRYQT